MPPYLKVALNAFKMPDLSCFSSWTAASAAEVSVSSSHRRCDRAVDIWDASAARLLLFGERWAVGSSVRPGDCLPFPLSASPISCPAQAPSSPASHPPSRWVTALSASGERGETERVQPHLLFYRQPAFSPRDLIITRPVERIAHEALSLTTIQTRKQDDMLMEKMQAYVAHARSIRACWLNRPAHPHRRVGTNCIKGWWRFSEAQDMQSSKWHSQYSLLAFSCAAVELGLNSACKQTLKVSKGSLQSQKGGAHEAVRCCCRLPAGSASALDETV